MFRFKFNNPGWAEGVKGAARGTAFFAEYMRQGTELLPEMPAPDEPAEAWGSALEQANGFFAVVARSEATVVAAVDRVRSIPLFFTE